MADAKTPLVDAQAVQAEIDYGAADASKPRSRTRLSQVPVVHSVTTKAPDGTTTTVRTMPKMDWLGMTEPPGGWHGPFGFLRMVALAFAFLSAIMLLTFFYAASEGENALTLAFCLILSAGSMLAAAAAYSHEGLAKQVTKMAKHNNQYSALNDSFKEQTAGLEKATAKIFDLVGGQESKVEEFKQQMSQLDQLSSLSEISTITRAFIDAQLTNKLFNPTSSDGDIDGLLSHSEVVSFIKSSVATLKERIPPKYDLEDLGREAFFPGLCITDINMLLAAVTTDIAEEKDCFMAVLYFFIDPREKGVVKEVTRTLRIHLKNDPRLGNEQALKAEILRLANTAPPGEEIEYAGKTRFVNGRIPPIECRKLARIVLHTFHEEDDEDLGISDDEL